MDSSTIALWTWPSPTEGVSGLLLGLLVIIEIIILNANRVNPDQTLHSAASDLGLHCLRMSHLWDARLKWVKGNLV